MPLTKLQKKTLEGGYLLPDETFEQAIRRVSKAYADSDAHAARLEEYILKNWMMPATPVFSNAGNKKGLPISCYLSSVEDSIDGLVDSWVENVYLTVGGGGIGNYFGNVRSIGAKTSRGGESLGIIGFLKTVEAQMLGYNQGGSRRGAAAIYLDISHPEIEEFITMRKPGGDPSRKCLSKAVFHHAVNIPDAFMHAVEKDEKWDLIDPNSKVVTKTVKARELWALLLETRVETGEPYIHFIDTSNRDYRARHKNSKLRIQQSNLCVHGDTQIFTSKGIFKIQDLKDETTEVWNGLEFSEVTIRQTGIDSDLLLVQFNPDGFLKCTPYHKFYIKEGDKVVIKEAYELKKGDILEEWKSPLASLSTHMRQELVTSSIKEVHRLPGVHDTFCFTEPKRQRGWFNGVVTGNCNEIYLPTNSERTAVCCLSSVNLETYDEWKDDELFIEDTVRMLDNVLTVFMDKTKGKPAFEKARNSVEKARDIGLGAMGFHSYLQKKGIPFESALAYSINKGIFENLWKKADLASGKLAAERGEPFDMHDMGRRNSHIMAIAPNASISLLADCSPGIEPYSTNYFVQKTKQGSFVQKNKHLKALLIELGKDNDRVWKSIRDNDGSVQHLDFLTEDQKNIFKTAFEIDQKWVIEHAAERQKNIDQGQSVNLFLLPGVHKKRLHDLHWAAWEKGLKGLYYCRSDTAKKAENLSTQVEKYDLVEPETEEGCVACGS